MRCVQALAGVPASELGQAKPFTAEGGLALVLTFGRVEGARIARTWAEVADLATFTAADAVLQIDVGTQAAALRGAIPGAHGAIGESLAMELDIQMVHGAPPRTAYRPLQYIDSR